MTGCDPEGLPFIRSWWSVWTSGKCSTKRVTFRPSGARKLATCVFVSPWTRRDVVGIRGNRAALPAGTIPLNLLVPSGTSVI